jgi:hypothetical protein
MTQRAAAEILTISLRSTCERRAGIASKARSHQFTAAVEPVVFSVTLTRVGLPD